VNAFSLFEVSRQPPRDPRHPVIEPLDSTLTKKRVLLLLFLQIGTEKVWMLLYSSRLLWSKYSSMAFIRARSSAHPSSAGVVDGSRRDACGFGMTSPLERGHALLQGRDLAAKHTKLRRTR
jgi:hypothetical protein